MVVWGQQSCYNDIDDVIVKPNCHPKKVWPAIIIKSSRHILRHANLFTSQASQPSSVMRGFTSTPFMVAQAPGLYPCALQPYRYSAPPSNQHGLYPQPGGPMPPTQGPGMGYPGQPMPGYPRAPSPNPPMAGYGGAPAPMPGYPNVPSQTPSMPAYGGSSMPIAPPIKVNRYHKYYSYCLGFQPFCPKVGLYNKYFKYFQ